MRQQLSGPVSPIESFAVRTQHIDPGFVGKAPFMPVVDVDKAQFNIYIKSAIHIEKGKIKISQATVISCNYFRYNKVNNHFF
jgi:hypothetical protein